MSNRLLIELSRKDAAIVSYFPGFEIKDDPGADWVQEALIPAIEPLTRRKTKSIYDVPITFWIAIRNTARLKAEIFVFTTPYNIGFKGERALKNALLPLNSGKVHQAIEPIPQYACPCCQIFRCKVILFYTFLEGEQGLFIPTLFWREKAPKLIFLKVPDKLVQIDNYKANHLLVRAEISPILDGIYYRTYQQNLIPIAKTDK
jgi:hypothetical protein